ncbi:MAG: exodeoxyribonuclease VII large subunit [Microbacteriaceae bacterium]|nr:exodeoxyribonuclease VII large subunit [Microbacteriaceae bacterium]
MLQQPQTKIPTKDTPASVAHVINVVSGAMNVLGSVWVEGEITAWKPAGRAIYGTLRDLKADAAIRFIIWGGYNSPKNSIFKTGDRVVVQATPNIYKKDSSLSFIISEISHVGAGQLMAQLEELKQKFMREGLFDLDRKKALPFLPKLIGLITGKDSDAEKDVLRNAHLRWPGVQFHTKHVLVQGAKSAEEITAAIQELDANPEIDVIIIARGGGDFMDLLSFSDERVVRAASGASTPIVSAIGHEADCPLLDGVADLRASTPTDAAKRVVPDIAEQQQKLQEARNRMRIILLQQINYQIEGVQNLRQRPVFRDPFTIITGRNDEVQRLASNCFTIAERRISDAHHHILQLHSKLQGLSPLRTLQRGYSVVQQTDGTIVQSAKQVDKGTELKITTAEGTITATAK